MFIARELRNGFALRQECYVRDDITDMSLAAARASIDIALLTECETHVGRWL
jgi:hypothetical protein